MITLLNKALKKAKRLIIIVFGFTILISGILMLVLPGPGILVILLALGILATEFIWARIMLNKIKDVYEKQKKRIMNNGNGGKNVFTKTKAIQRK
jgi:uncharacterized protein (TIGR02611 family)